VTPVRRAPSGFTLVEMLLVIALFVLAVILATNIFINNQRAQISAGSYDRLVADTRTALDIVSQSVRSMGIDYSAYRDPNRDGSPADATDLGAPVSILRLRDFQSGQTLFGLAADGTISTCTIDPSRPVNDQANKCDAATGGANWNPVTSSATSFTTLSFTIVPAANALQYAPERAADCKRGAGPGMGQHDAATGICRCTLAATDCLADQICTGGACRFDPTADSLQPRVTILLNGQTKKGQLLRNPVQTTVVSRFYQR
jgi:prepilin-type N-terminal cleavage/methylation domain-containing protein